jgi:probable HAF family extracellular repeat protein
MLRTIRGRILLVVIAGAFVAPTGLIIVCDRIDLGTLGGDRSVAAGINAAEQVVGGAETAAGQWHAFLWQNKIMTDLGTLGGENSEAHAITQTFEPLIVGTSEKPNRYDPNQVLDRAFLWREGAMTDLGSPAWEQNSEAWGVSDTGLVVGTAQKWSSGFWRAFLWSDGVMTDLGTLGGDESCALAVNNVGQVVGWSQRTADPYDANELYPPPIRRAFLWQNGVMTDLGTLGGLNSEAYGITEDGWVVGWAETAGGSPNDPNQAVQRHAFLWSPEGGMQDLGTLGGSMAEVWGAGSSGVVGWSLDANDALQGFVWQPPGALEPLGQPLSGGGPVFGYGIAGSGTVVGSAENSQGYERAFLKR